MTAYERARDEQVEKNLAMLESLGIKDLIASLPALYRSSQRKGTKKRKSKVAIGNDEEFLPPLTAAAASYGFCSAAALCSPTLLSASFLSRKCNPVVERRAEELTEEVISQRSTIDSLTVKTNRLESLYEKLASRMDMGSSPTSTW
ncbi:hypothetical protein RHMOL_Rhmol10G0221900 [Rhododendron molle]|uniref:Uncharacterized protein n=1 Tax=Rhododendron molle TaxID=49168 RepID=A0ACC0M622_RHOML|nr:hypothetical protein RHMOL_Rhmol10G0221900 [Rhododendron molle]